MRYVPNADIIIILFKEILHDVIKISTGNKGVGGSVIPWSKTYIQYKDNVTSPPDLSSFNSAYFLFTQIITFFPRETKGFII